MESQKVGHSKANSQSQRFPDVLSEVLQQGLFAMFKMFLVLPVHLYITIIISWKCEQNLQDFGLKNLLTLGWPIFLEPALLQSKSSALNLSQEWQKLMKLNHQKWKESIVRAVNRKCSPCSFIWLKINDFLFLQLHFRDAVIQHDNIYLFVLSTGHIVLYNRKRKYLFTIGSVIWANFQKKIYQLSQIAAHWRHLD